MSTSTSTSTLRSTLLTLSTSPTPASTVSTLLSLLGTTRQKSSLLHETLSTLTTPESLTVFLTLEKAVKEITEEELYIPESCYEDGGEEEDGEAEERLRFLGGVGDVVRK